MFKPKAPMDRFMGYVRKDISGCWLWESAKVENGYGRFYIGMKKFAAHRWIYEQLIGPIPEGLQLDHICRVRDCVNPAHLSPLTQKENLLAGNGWAAKNARKTHCKRGHALTPKNIYTRPSNPSWRICRICKGLVLT